MSARTQRTNHSSANAAVAAVALTAGLSPAELGRICELPFVDLFSSRRLPERAVYAIITWLERSDPERAIGLELARQVPLSLLGPVEQAARYASDVRELIELAVEHASVLSTGLELKLELGLETSALRMSHALDVHGGSLGPELVFGATARLLEQLLDRTDESALSELRHAAGDLDPAVRAAAIRGLGAIGGASDDDAGHGGQRLQ